jgi:hypothetical protein
VNDPQSIQLVDQDGTFGVPHEVLAPGDDDPFAVGRGVRLLAVDIVADGCRAGQLDDPRAADRIVPTIR